MVAEEKANLLVTIGGPQKKSQPVSDNLNVTEKTNPLVIDRRLEKGNLLC